MESGKEYRYYKGRKPREWTLGFAGNAQTIKEIEDFFNSMKGPFFFFQMDTAERVQVGGRAL